MLMIPCPCCGSLLTEGEYQRIILLNSNNGGKVHCSKCPTTEVSNVLLG